MHLITSRTQFWIHFQSSIRFQSQLASLKTQTSPMTFYVTNKALAVNWFVLGRKLFALCLTCSLIMNTIIIPSSVQSLVNSLSLRLTYLSLDSLLGSLSTRVVRISALSSQLTCYYCFQICNNLRSLSSKFYEPLAFCFLILLILKVNQAFH